MTKASAKIIADSISRAGVRLVSIQETFWRPVLAERNTHTSQGKNSASSRAIPFEKQFAKFCDDFAYPVSWPAEQSGMQGGAELEGEDFADALQLWDDLREAIAGRLTRYLIEHPDKATRLHKSVLNRVIEYGQMHTAIVTATAWENYFELRCDPDAQPEIREVALAAREAYRNSEPTLLTEGEWHLPYVDDETRAQIERDLDGPELTRALCMVSAARCARTSYETQEGKRDYLADLDLYDKLITERAAAGKGLHWSPLQHVATPWQLNHLRMGLPFRGIDGETHTTSADVPYVGNLLGWRSLRTEVESDLGANTFR